MTVMTQVSAARRMLFNRMPSGSIIAPRIAVVLCLLQLLMLLLIPTPAAAQDNDNPVYNPAWSIARNWNEVLLYAIRRDLARPTVHARNLFHASAVMYDSWALYADGPSLYFLGRVLAPDNTALNACEFPTQTRRAWQDLNDAELVAARETTLSFALYRLLTHRFDESPGAVEILQRIDALFAALQHDSTLDSTDIANDATPARLGNYLAKCAIDFGRVDGSNESNNYANSRYTTINPPLNPVTSGNPGLNDPNRWQSLQLDIFVDQSGNQTDVPVFLGAEWNEVEPFALDAADLSEVVRDNHRYQTYLNPGPPVLLGDDPVANRDYQSGHALVALWSSHLDPGDGVIWDISPANLGNVASLPTDDVSLLDFYKALEGGTQELGYAINPVTGLPYAEVRVPRGDFSTIQWSATIPHSRVTMAALAMLLILWNMIFALILR